MDRHIKVMFGATFAIIAGISMLSVGGREVDTASRVAVPVKEKRASLASDYPVESCKAAIALIMDRDPKTISGAKLSGGLTHLSYIRPDDGKRWQARCEMIDDDQLRWAAFDAFGDGAQGRWRDEDSIQVLIKDGQVQIELDQSGATMKQRSYDLSSLA